MSITRTVGGCAGHVVRVLTLFWCLIVIGGLAGVLFPTVGFSTPAESVFPQSLLSDQTILYFVHPYFSEVSNYFGYSTSRPKVFFAYTNQWGGCVALLTPFVFASLATLGAAISPGADLPVSSLTDPDRDVAGPRSVGWAGCGCSVRGRPCPRAGFAGTARDSRYERGCGGIRDRREPLGTLIGSRVTSSQNSNSTRSNVYGQAIAQDREVPSARLRVTPSRSDRALHQSKPSRRGYPRPIPVGSFLERRAWTARLYRLLPDRVPALAQDPMGPRFLGERSAGGGHRRDALLRLHAYQFAHHDDRRCAGSARGLTCPRPGAAARGALGFGEARGEEPRVRGSRPRQAIALSEGHGRTRSPCVIAGGTGL